jgi:hypothetical protein
MVYHSHLVAKEQDLVNSILPLPMNNPESVIKK